MLRASRGAILSSMVDEELDRELEKAQAALLARFAPETRVRRIRWSQGETQLFELGVRRAAAVRPRWVGRRIRGRADPRGARREPPRARGRSAGPRARRSVRLPRRRPARPRSDVPGRRLDAARAPDRRRGRQLAGRALVRRLRDRRLQPRVAPCARRRAVRDRATGRRSRCFRSGSRSSARGSAGTCSRMRRATGAGSSGASSSSSIPSESTICCSTSTSRTRDETSRACSA